MTGARAIAAWTGPALVAAVVAGVAGGASAAPVLLLAAAVAPSLALLQARRASATPHPTTLVLTAVVAALLLWAHLALLADAAVLLGARRWQGTVLAAALALLVTLMPGAARWRVAALALGGGALGLALLAIAAAAGITPTQAWRQAAARPALVFSGRSAWVTGGGRFVRGATLTFDEGHRVVAVAPGTFRVVEAPSAHKQDGVEHVIRDWRLEAGDAVSLRPGDTLTAETGSRLHFEPGKRVPGAAPSGSVWAEAATGASFGHALGVLATLGLGALALVPAGDRRAAAAPVALLACSLGAAAWGVYATLAAPEAGLSGSPAEVLLARALTPGALAAVVALGLLALFVAAADALRERVAETSPTRWPEAWTTAMVAAALAATLPVVDPWTPLAAGLGLAGAAVAAPRLAAGENAGRRLGWPVEVIGALLGAAVFVALMAATLPAAVASLGAWPVLVAAPVAFSIVRLLRTPPG